MNLKRHGKKPCAVCFLLQTEKWVKQTNGWTIRLKKCSFESNYIGEEVIEATAEHPFWLDGKGWTEVKALKVGDLLVSSDSTKLEIDRIVKEQREAKVYNFQVKDFHSYFVSNLGIWVYNCLTWTGKGFNQLAKNNSANDLIKNLEDAGWTKTIEAGGKKSRDATIFVDSKTGTKVRILLNREKAHRTLGFKTKVGAILMTVVFSLVMQVNKN
ncbi:polymorphic toxin-type HINT domain-containing protein [Paenibacillus sp. 2TAB23]|uniref:polymorphic toxin-type HINT domain-containing protein n=1 Tax=Paenibacillus sp. 2TAB23 TaxID=3233004 RepID=UPI003F94E066